MAFNLNNYLLDNVIRLLRHNWGGGTTLMLSQEIVAYISGIQRGFDEITGTDANGNPITVPFGDLPTFPGIPPWDPDLPDNPFPDPPTPVPPDPDDPNPPGPDPNNPQDPNDPTDPGSPDDGGDTTETTQVTTHRNTFPGKILSSSGDSYRVRLFINGPTDDSLNREVDAGGLVSGLVLPVGAYVNVYMTAKFTATTTAGGRGTTGDLQATDVRYAIMPPTGALAITTSEIAAMNEDELTPGTGTAVLRNFDSEGDGGEGEWSDGETITVYNSTSGPVEADKMIQVKELYGLWFVDVEDCSGTISSSGE